jgi:hypothetical protein
MWIHLAVAVGIFALGMGVAQYIVVMLSRWQGVRTATRRSPPPFHLNFIREHF